MVYIPGTLSLRLGGLSLLLLSLILSLLLFLLLSLLGGRDYSVGLQQAYRTKPKVSMLTEASCKGHCGLAECLQYGILADMEEAETLSLSLCLLLSHLRATLSLRLSISFFLLCIRFSSCHRATISGMS